MHLNTCGVLLYDEAFTDLETALKPYVHEGSIGKYIYCQKAEDDGIFLRLTISPEQVTNRIKDTMQILIPLRYVKFIASASSNKSLGFE